MKKYVYADIVRQAKLTLTERKLVEIVVLTTNQNHKFLARVIDGTLNLGVKAIEIREALYHVAPYIGFPKVFEALEVADEVFTKHGIALPLEAQGTTSDAETKEEVIGVITVMNPYIGFPRTLNALRIANEVFTERAKQ